MNNVSKIIVPLFAAFCFVITVIFAAGRDSHVQISKTGKITVMTYNVHQGFDNNGKPDPRKILKTISESGADIIGLQESETNRLISGNYDLVFWLAKKLKMDYYYGPPVKKGTYGVSILSRYPIKTSKTIYLESITDQRVLIESVILFNDKEIKVLVTHLGLSVEERFNQTSWIYENKIKTNAMPLILMGDLNTEAWEDFITNYKPEFIKNRWYNKRLENYQKMLNESREKNISSKAKNIGYNGLANYRNALNDTWKIANPNKVDAYTWSDPNDSNNMPVEKLDIPVRIDYIFSSKDFIVKESMIIDNHITRSASDHLPVVSRLELK